MEAERMHRGMLLLAERLVIAMEAMSQDVKNMSAYVFDISCSVSFLLNERKEKDSTSVVSYDEGEYPSSAVSGQDVQADESPSSFVDPGNRDDSFLVMATTNIDPDRNSDALSTQSNLDLTGGIKTEVQFEVEVNNESRDVDDMFGNSGNSVRNCTAYMPSLPETEPLEARPRPIESTEEIFMVPTRVDSKKEPYNCSVCKKSFKFYSELERHFRVHSGERPYECKVCGKRFSRNKDLTVHMRSHTGQRPYSCDVCGKAFSRTSNLGVHIRTHTGQKPYKCNICEKVFTQKSHLNTHMLTHWRSSIKV